MLTTTQKAIILRQTGFVVPDAPSMTLQAWTGAIETLFTSFAAARAAKSLRDAQDKHRLEELRGMSADGSGRARARRA